MSEFMNLERREGLIKNTPVLKNETKTIFYIFSLSFFLVKYKDVGNLGRAFGTLVAKLCQKNIF